MNKREVIDMTVDVVFEAGIKSRSRSPMSFPIVVIVDKKEVSKRFCVVFRKLNQIRNKLNETPSCY